MKKKAYIILWITFSVLFFVDQKLNFQVADLKSKDLSTFAFGYHFKAKPFTGFIYNKKETGSVDKIIFVVNGLLHGPEIYWYENGQLWIERNYRSGKEHGLQKAWHPDGRPLSLKSFTNGIPDGDFFEWFKDGRLSSYIKYENGIEMAAKMWTGSGKPFYNYSWRNQERIGLLGDRYCTKLK